MSKRNSRSTNHLAGLGAAAVIGLASAAGAAGAETFESMEYGEADVTYEIVDSAKLGVDAAGAAVARDSPECVYYDHNLVSYPAWAMGSAGAAALQAVGFEALDAYGDPPAPRTVAETTPGGTSSPKPDAKEIEAPGESGVAPIADDDDNEHGPGFGYGPSLGEMPATYFDDDDNDDGG